jgi:seryl-tRNA synthetase
MDEAENKVERTWGDDKKKAKAALSHHEVMYRLGAYDPERGVKLVGHRGYCLTGMGFFLNQALISKFYFAIDLYYRNKQLTR